MLYKSHFSNGAYVDVLDINEDAEKIAFARDAHANGHQQLKSHFCPKSVYTGVVAKTTSVAEIVLPHMKWNSIHEDRVNPYTLILRLPDFLESNIVEIALQKPKGCSYPSLSLKRNDCYLSWWVRPYLQFGDANRKRRHCRVTVPTADLHALLGKVYTVEESETLTCELEDVESEAGKSKNDWIPVILLSGETVVVTAFNLDEGDMNSLNASDMHNAHYYPEAVFTAEEIASAKELAQKYGDHPWFDGIWKDEECDIVGLRCITET